MSIERSNALKSPLKPSEFGIIHYTISLFFIGIIIFFVGHTYLSISGGTLLVVGAVIGGYMAINIGANDVANNVGPAVGSKALTLVGAIIIAGIFEALGAIIAGGDVVSTIKKGIIDPGLINNSDTFIWLMLAALLAGAVWLNIATSMGAPVSTTHSIVGGVLGAGIAAGGFGIANWNTMGMIAASWVISPLLGGIIAAAFLLFIKRTITYKPDMIEAAKRIVPLLVIIMSWAFSTYLILKGLKKVWKVEIDSALMMGIVISVLVYIIVKPVFARISSTLPNTRKSINKLFTMPLIFSAALLCFAHGANDVANAIGPLAAIADATMNGGVAAKADIPFWIMLIGAAGIVVGLALFGPKLIRTVGTEITELDQMRAFSVAMAAAITVIIATQMGLPVSSTHITVGAVFGVGFLREFLKARYAKMVDQILENHPSEDHEVLQVFLGDFRKASIREKAQTLKELKMKKAEAELSKKDRKKLKKYFKKELVKRTAFKRIIAAWLITVPASGVMAALFFFTIRGMLLP